MPIEHVLGLAGSLFAGALFVLASLRRRPAVLAPETPVQEAPHGTTPASEPPEIYWPVLLGTGQRHFDKTMRMAIVRRLAVETADWRIPILLCAREQEDDAEMVAAIDRALGGAIVPVIGAPR
jgi:hypothetical protein